MKIAVITLFPQMFDALQFGVVGKAIKDRLFELKLFDLREFGLSKHRNVDDRPYGGGPGMVLMPGPLKQAIDAAKAELGNDAKVVYLSPQGKIFNQKLGEDSINCESLVLIAGRYEGIDQRIIDNEVDEEWSVGDFILSGGELASMVIVDTIARLIPGVLGHGESASLDSLSSGLLKYPQYTRPEEFAGQAVPAVLLKGNHEDIAEWRLKQSLGKTWVRRPDLLKNQELGKNETKLLQEFIEQSNKTN